MDVSEETEWVNEIMSGQSGDMSEWVTQ